MQQLNGVFRERERDMESTARNGVEIFFFPETFAGHLRPMMGMAELFSSHGAKTTILTSTTLQSPHHSLLLPPSSTVQDSFRRLLQDNPLPSCVIFDAFFPWVVDIAREFSVPAFAFHGSSSFSSCAQSALASNPPLGKSFFLPGLPDRVEFLRTQMPDLDHPIIKEVLGNIALSKASCDGLIMNSFEELEKQYLEKISTVLGKEVWSVGPLPVMSDHEESNKYLQWLDGKEPGSVVYVCFGSTGEHGDEQNTEIAAALETLGRPFIWVAPNQSEEKLFPEKENHGIVISGWAPQSTILSHGAVGAFVTHCGWNSCIEAIAAGVPMVAWPLMAEQFYNGKLVTEVLGAGVEVGNKIWAIKAEDRELIGREEIAGAIEGVIGEGERAAEVRSRVRELGKSAKRAVAEGGSSWNAVNRILEKLRGGERRIKEQSAA